MPTYQCTTLVNRLTAQQKAGIAKEITRTHTAVTGAAGFFAQVIFHEVMSENYFIGGAPLKSDQLFLHGQIRGGRSALDRKRLMSELLNVVSEAAGMSKASVWVYLIDLPPKDMIEFGQFLPEPGEEGKWLASLTQAERERLQSIG